MTVITRFAPSPTGRLHVGNIRAALHNWMCARNAGGTFILRLDDTDKERSTEEFATSIIEDLGWLGLHFDAVYRQSERFAIYDVAFEKLRADGRVYPCYETQQELDLKRKILAGRGLPPVYDRGALALSDADRAKLEADGVQPHWRFKLDHTAPIVWDDLIRGPQKFEAQHLSDPVIRRADGSWLYMLPSMIDDADMGVTHVVRGEDHVSNTALQLQMFTALGATPPAFAHEALLTGSEGKLSKRLGSLGCDSFREEGIEPIALAALLARIGTSAPVEPVTEITPLLETFDFAQFSRAPARFDLDELKLLNAKIVRHMPYDAVSDRLPASMDSEAWAVISQNINQMADVADWWAIVEGPISPDIAPDDKVFLADALAISQGLAWDGSEWQALTAALKEKTGRKGKALFLPLRQALTARDHGPEMHAILSLLGKDRTVERLAAASA